VSDAVARLRAGEPHAALARAGAALAELAGDDVAVVECLLVMGRCHQALADHRRARATLERARRAAAALDEPLVVIEVLAALGTQDRLEGRYHDAHRRLGEAVARAVDVAGEDSVMVACLRNDLAVCCKYLARFDEAEGLYGQAMATLEARLGPGDAEVAGVWHNLAGLAHARGDHPTAVVRGRRGLAIRVAALGEDHLDVAADRAALAPILDGLGRHDEAEQLLRRALDVFERALGTEHHEVAVTLHNLAAVHHRRGDLETAATAYRRSLEIRAGVLGDDHPELGTTLVNLAVLERAQGDHHAAAGRLRHAIELLEPAVPADHPTLVAARQEHDQLVDHA
jgi:tetratricopeptide (TPR) repeat protein